MNRKDFVKILKEEKLTIQDIATSELYFNYYIQYKNEEIMRILERNQKYVR